MDAFDSVQETIDILEECYLAKKCSSEWISTEISRLRKARAVLEATVRQYDRWMESGLDKLVEVCDSFETNASQAVQDHITHAKPTLFPCLQKRLHFIKQALKAFLEGRVATFEAGSIPELTLSHGEADGELADSFHSHIYEPLTCIQKKIENLTMQLRKSASFKEVIAVVHQKRAGQHSKIIKIVESYLENNPEKGNIA
ncbi:hypothetical protein XU18_0426 [Perkinsela sp. CCAP 1560/4]|nr:hypothetical protein XU18_0426 [Perkinsela sp. CCAP 1560/4]|eukprot:KNH09741.1 hypothetical protein XU18_0426 [Perkinsela sp. CCAP 1560/4]